MPNRCRGGAEFASQRLVLFAATEGRNAIAKFVGELNAEMAEAADSLDGNQVARAGAAVAQGIECGGARVSHAEPNAVFDEMVPEANAAGLHADAHMSRGGLGNLAFL
jgi:hypothetical protein